MAERRVTIADVAADAGVGVGTVSRVLNGSDQVRESTMRAVLDSIDRLGYRPSYAAAALVRGSPRTVALIVAHMTRPSTVVRVASALAVLEEQGYDAIVYNVDSPAERDRHLEALLPTQRADGVLAICLPLSRGQLGQFAGPASRWSAWTRQTPACRRRSSTTWPAAGSRPGTSSRWGTGGSASSAT